MAASALESEPPDPPIRIEKLVKSYGKRPALRDLSLEVATGSLFGFIGPNGAGKTTTIRILMGFLRADAGSVRIGGRDCWRETRSIKARVGYLPGDLQLPGWLTAEHACRLCSRARGTSLESAFRGLLEAFALEGGVPVREMSRGMRQKLGLITALAHDPSLLILDEPTTALDPLNRGVLYDLLRERAARGTTVFFSSHVLSEVAELCDRVAIIRAGEIVAADALEALARRAKRQLTLTWSADTPAPQPPPFLSLTEHRAHHWTAWLNAEIPELLAWLEGHPPIDMTLGPPDLDSLFRTYYTDEVAP